MTNKRPLGLTAAAFDAWPSTGAVVAVDGMVIAVNNAWRTFGEQNGAGARCGPGTNYLDVTYRAAASGDEVAGAVAAMLTAVFLGHAPSARVDYPCHSPQQQRWFRLRARPLPRRQGVLLVHDDITDLVVLQQHDNQDLARPALRAASTGEDCVSAASCVGDAHPGRRDVTGPGLPTVPPRPDRP